MQQAITCDVLISGGGPVGLILALGLAQKLQNIVLAEAYWPVAEAPNSFDGRVLALSYGSMKVLSELGIWQDLMPFVTQIKHVHVSQKGYLGLTTLHAEELGVPALGYSIQSCDLGRVLWQHVENNASIQVLCPARVVDFQMDEAQVCAQVALDVDSKAESVDVRAKLIVGADGTHSQVRQVLQLPLEEKSYQAVGVLAQVETEHPHCNWAFERFTEEGPVALLPMKTHSHKAVLVCPESEIEQVKALSDSEFIGLFSSKMGERLGAFTSVSERVFYPLKETYAPQMTKGRAVLMGNASHTQHPVAAQGLNLGIEDIKVFLNQVASLVPVRDTEQKECQIDLGAPEFLKNYAVLRQPSHEKVMGLTDGLIQIFQHHSPIVGHLRGMGLMAMQMMPALKKRFVRFAMGGEK